MTETAPPPKTDAAGRGAGVRGWCCVGLALLLLGASGLLVARGVARGLDGSLDFTMVYAGGRQLALGDDPYHFDRAYDAFVEAGGAGRPRDPAWFALLYPPFTYALLAPLGLIPWAEAKAVWLAANLIATAAVAGWLVRHRPRRTAQAAEPAAARRTSWCGWSAAVAVSLWLACGSLHTAIAFGQLSVLPLALMLPLLGPGSSTTAWGWRRPRTVAAGAMLAAAGLLKPQLVAPVAFVLLFTRRRPAAVWAAGLGVLGVAASLAWVQSVTPDWYAHWRSQLAAFTASGMARPTMDNPFTHQMINLEPWLHRLWPGGVGPEAWFGVLGAGLPALGLILAAGLISRRRASPAEHPGLGRQGDDAVLLALGLACVLTLMLVYHRAYDAVLLVVPGLWAWRRLAERRRDGVAWVTLACLATFMLPGPVVLKVLEGRGAIPAVVADRWLWRAFLVPHQNAALVVLAFALGTRLWRTRPAPPAVPTRKASPTFGS
ncbi:MAG: glycosyltransferase family 87 protein [Planctomycetota bacterium]